jgi:hypothetical protein
MSIKLNVSGIFFIIAQRLLNIRNNALPWKHKTTTKVVYFYSGKPTGKVTNGPESNFLFFTDICKRVSVFSEELTMQFHIASDKGTNFFSPISVMSVEKQQPVKKY